MKKYIIIGVISFVLVTLAVLINGFEEKYYKIAMIEKNPTSYIFDINIWELKKLIKNNFEDIRKELKFDFRGELRDTSVVKTKFFNSELKLNEVIITSLVFDRLFLNSEIYYYDKYEKTISYSTSFQINMQKLGENKTFVKIITLQSSIFVIKKSILPIAPGFDNMYDVEPSTIEEYKILLFIGDKLGIKNEMPRIIIPEIPSK